jgi:hypothetical protein
MKNISLIILLTLFSFAVNSQISRGDAAYIIANEVVGLDSLEIHHLYSKYEKMYLNDTLWLDGYMEYYVAPYEESWVFFIDLMPVAYWAHPCQIIFFDVSNSNYVLYDDDWPPDPFLMNIMEFLNQWERILSVGTESLKAYNGNILKISPNPFVNEISIKYENTRSETLLIKIIDISGKSIMAVKRNIGLSENGVITLNTTDIKPGIYFVQVSTKNKIFLFNGKTDKLIKSRL